MELRLIGLMAFVALVVAGCGIGTQVRSTFEVVGSPSQPSSVAASAGAPPLVGTWTRTQDCETMLAAFKEAGLAESHADWIVGNWVGDPADVEVDPNNLCADARPAQEHSHFFTENGRFGSYDDKGAQVDDGAYVMEDADTLSFPTHSTEFGYGGDILVDYAVSGDLVTFEVRPPSECEDSCLDAYAWALSAFFGPDPWRRTD